MSGARAVHRRCAPWWLLAALLGSTASHAQALYVVEQLVVSINSDPDGSGERIATLKSGDRVELIERAGDAAHVRLASGQDGWLRSSYLTADEPLRTQLAARSAQVAHLQDAVQRLEEQLRSARAVSAAAPHTAAAAPPAGVTTAPAPGAAVPAANVPGAPAPTEEAAAARGGWFATAAAPHAGPGWLWVSLSALLAACAGFALGWFVLDRRIRAKFGGLRIY